MRRRMFRLADGRIATVRVAPNGNLLVKTLDGKTRVVKGSWTL